MTIGGAKRALLVDLDNTLIDRDAAFLAWIEGLRACAPALDPRALDPQALDPQRMVELDRGGYGDKRALFTAIGRALATTAPRVRARYEAELPELVALEEDAAQLLDAFPGAKIVITNGDSALQRAKVRAARIAQRVDAVIVSSEHGHAKPHPSIFLEALARAGARPEEALMVGDHPVADIAGARAVGVTAWMRRTRWFAVPPGVTSVGKLTEVTF